MKGYRVNYYIFTDNPETIPDVQLQPGQRFVMEKYPSWQEISMRTMEAINKHIAETSHQDVDCLFCLAIDMVFYNSWGPETLGDTVAAIHPGYFNVPRSQFPMRGGALQQPTSLMEKGTSATEEPCLVGWSRKSMSSPRLVT